MKEMLEPIDSVSIIVKLKHSFLRWINNLDLENEMSIFCNLSI